MAKVNGAAAIILASLLLGLTATLCLFKLQAMPSSALLMTRTSHERRADSTDHGVQEVDLGTAANYAILTKTGISTVPSSSITGNIGVSPVAGTYMTGFSFTRDSSKEFATSAQITGFAYAPTDNIPTPATLTTAVSDMETAYTSASQRANTQGYNLGDGNIGGMTLTTGVYTFFMAININSDITFSGGASDIFILQTTGALMQAASTKVILSGGAQAKNIFWQVAGTVEVGASAVMQGILLAKTNVVFVTSSSLTGRILAQTECALQKATITQPPAAPEAATPFNIMTCAGEAVLTTASMTCAQYDAVAGSVATLLSSLPEQCDAAGCPQADWAGCILRLAGHDFMDFAEGQGGSDACTDMNDIDNAGLAACLYRGEFGISVQDAYAEHCTSVSLADFLVIAAEAVMTETRQRVLADDATARPIDFRSTFRYGRTTAVTCEFAAGRLPNPERSCTAVDETFVQSMGLTWRQSAALMGVHTLGRANVSNSGYDGFWSDAENSRRFNNNYYVSILNKGWMPEKAVIGNSAKNQWQLVDQGKDHQGVRGKHMMLDTDLCLAYTKDRAGLVELKAENADCCAWITANLIHAAGVSEFCGNTERFGFRDQRGVCCNGDTRATDCGRASDPKGPAFTAVQEFALNEGIWLEVFAEAWAIATTNGQGSLQALAECV